MPDFSPTPAGSDSATHLIRRGAVYYFRRKVPSVLRAHYQKEEIRKSLHTTDRAQALRLAAQEASRLESEFAFLRKQLAPLQATRRPAPAPSGAGPLGVVFEIWKARRERPRTTLYDFAKAARRFSALHPELPVTQIAPTHIEAFKKALLAENISVATAKKQFGALAAMLEVAVEEGLLARNPARAIRLPAASQEKMRLPFEQAELRAIFSTPIYARGERPEGGADAAAYWLPLLALYTGARQGEIGQLHADDLGQDQGINYLRFRAGPEDEARARTRMLPLHPDLIRLGFLQFAEMQRRAGSARLFPELRADNKNKLTGNWSKWFGRYLRQVAGVSDSRKSFDSFRHSFLEACAEAQLDPSLIDALTGHATPGQWSLHTLSEAIQKLRFSLI
jgi:integrase